MAAGPVADGDKHLLRAMGSVTGSGPSPLLRYHGGGAWDRRPNVLVVRLSNPRHNPLISPSCNRPPLFSTNRRPPGPDGLWIHPPCRPAPGGRTRGQSRCVFQTQTFLLESNPSLPP